EEIGAFVKVGDCDERLFWKCAVHAERTANVFAVNNSFAEHRSKGPGRMCPPKGPRGHGGDHAGRIAGAATISVDRDHLVEAEAGLGEPAEKSGRGLQRGGYGGRRHLS